LLGYLFTAIILVIVLVNATFMAVGALGKLALKLKRIYIHNKVKRAIKRRDKFRHNRLFTRAEQLSRFEDV
jgi:hypothetical protein